MFSDRRYSLTRYSVNREIQTIEISQAFSESMGMLAGAAVPVDFRVRYGEICQGAVRGTASVISTLSGREDLRTQARMSADVVTRSSLMEFFQASVYGQKNMPAALDVQSVLDGIPYGSKDVPAALGLVDILSARVFASKDIPVGIIASEVLTSMLEAISQTTERAVFQVTIPPGGELRIDSELYTVLLNGQNALHTQSGDWVRISRELLRVTVECASGGGLNGQLIYTERYL